ncbi:unnamed protein product [Schistosoma margrebowiei]|uniref:Uncharacterized protein n=1 Tax=Schistosoma margrebowiei TaxID=48269 RepID=A0A183LJ79_9TREM|nr:unnamed protein product [Schistosoma margrebowiei]
MEDNCKRIKEAPTSTYQQILSLNQHHQNGCITTKTLDTIHERKKKKTAMNNSETRTEKVKTRAEYTGANKRVKTASWMTS